MASLLSLVCASIVIVSFANLLSPLQARMCPPQCRCTSSETLCSCQQSDSFLLTEIPLNHLIITISNCKQVGIRGNPFNGLRLDRVVIQDSFNVHITDINFLGVRSIRRVKFSNIAHLTLGSLYSLKADIFEMTNITTEQFDKNVIPGIAELKEIRITDSRIGTIKTGALHIQHEDSFDIIDSTIENVESSSICIDQVQTFSIRNCLMTGLSEDALNIMHVGKVVLSGNSIHTINEGSFLADDVGKMVIVQNEFKRVEPNSFYHMGNVSKFTMSENRFLHVARNGLLLHLKVEDPSIVIESNQFACDCNLRWLWEERGYHKFDKFFNSTCYAPDKLAGIAITQVIPLNRLDGDCLRVETKEFVQGQRRQNIIQIDPGFYAVNAVVKLRFSPPFLVMVVTMATFVAASQSV